MKRFYCPIFGEVDLGVIYTWIRVLVKKLGYSNVEYDPIFDMVDIGQTVEIRWLDPTGMKFLSFERTA
jgi:hypothetical protein